MLGSGFCSVFEARGVEEAVDFEYANYWDCEETHGIQPRVASMRGCEFCKSRVSTGVIAHRVVGMAKITTSGFGPALVSRLTGLRRDIMFLSRHVSI